MMTQGYIGVSGNVEKRFASHKGMWSGTNKHLCNAIKKNGWNNLVKSIVLIAEKEYCLNIEKKLRSANKIGWNLTIGGGYPPIISGERPNLKGRTAWNKGKTRIYSQETLEKMSKSRLGRTPANKGIPHTEETKAKLSKILKGRPSPLLGKKMPQEIVDKVAAKNRGRIQSLEERAKRSLILKGIKKSMPRSEEHSKKLGLYAKGRRWYNNGEYVVFCHEGKQPDGYNLGRGNKKMTSKKVESETCHV